MATSTLQILLTLKDHASRELKKFDLSLGKVGKAAAVVGASIAGMAVTVGAALGKAINETVEYGKAVDDFSRALNIGSEEASKMIQLADDLRISQETLKISLRTALREGYLPNIEGLKQMAGEYQQLTSPVERAQYALKNFGRAGLEMQKVLELAPEQIDEMVSGFEDLGLVLSEEDIKATKELYAAMDNLSDLFEGFKYQIALGVMPELSKFLTSVFKVASAMKILQKGMDEGNITLLEAFDALSKLTHEEWDLADVQRFANDQVFSGHKVMGMLAEETENAAEGMDEAGVEAQELAARLLEVNRSSQEAIETLRDFNKQQIEDAFDIDIDPGAIASKLFDVVAFQQAGGESINAFIETVKAAWAQGMISDDEAKEFFGNAYAEAQNLGVELGDLDLSEAEENISKSLHIPIEDAKRLLDEAKNSADTLGATKLDALKAEFDALQERKAMLIGAGELDPENQLVINADPNDVALQKLGRIESELIGMTSRTWYINTEITRTGAIGSHGQRRQGGGYVSPYNAYLVGERGPELFVPSGGGNIVPNHRLGAGGRSVVINQHFYNEGSAALGLAMVDEYSGRRLDASMGG